MELHNWRIVLRNRREGHEPRTRAYTGTEAEMNGLAGDLWNRYAAHMPDRGWRLSVYRDKETRACMVISG